MTTDERTKLELDQAKEAEKSLISLAAHPGWQIIEARMNKTLEDADRVLEECGDATDNYRLHRACSIRKVLVTLLRMVREAPVRHAALVSGAVGPVAKPSPDSLV